MSITLSHGGTVIHLPPDLIWADELTWSAVAQSTERSITGALLVDAMARQGGRPIALQGDSTSAWIERGVLRQLRAWAATPALEMVLSLRGDMHTVIFDHGEDETSAAMAMQAVVDYCDPVTGDYYCSLVLRFLTINP